MALVRQDTVSVIIPCYNAASFLRETLDSVLTQTHPPLEVLLIDDGSTDDSAAIAQSYGEPVRVIRQENQGESVARNRGIDEARGEWLAFLDADDVWEPQKLECQLAAIAPDIVCIHSNFYLYSPTEMERRDCSIPPSFGFTVEELATQSVTVFATMLVRREDSPRFPVWTRHGEDRIYQMELALRGNSAVVREALYGYRKHDNSQTTAEPRRNMLAHQGIEEWLKRRQKVVDKDLAARIRDHWLRIVVRDARRARRSRDWSTYWSTREHVCDFKGHPQVEALLAERIYPHWMYTMKDRLIRPLKR